MTPVFIHGSRGQTKAWPGQTDYFALPMRRIGLSEDIAATALLLASRDAGFATAQTIHVNRGLWS